jgi:hypothetical protein
MEASKSRKPRVCMPNFLADRDYLAYLRQEEVEEIQKQLESSSLALGVNQCGPACPTWGAVLDPLHKNVLWICREHKGKAINVISDDKEYSSRV